MKKVHHTMFAPSIFVDLSIHLWSRNMYVRIPESLFTVFIIPILQSHHQGHHQMCSLDHLHHRPPHHRRRHLSPCGD